MQKGSVGCLSLPSTLDSLDYISIVTGSISLSPNNAELLNAIRADSTAYEDNDDADANDVALLKVALENVVAAKAQGELHRRKTMNRQQLLQLFRLYHGSSKCIRIPATIARMRACRNWRAGQPGETYYYSPLIVPISGIAERNLSDENDHLHAYVYYEQEAKKGDNNVCSLIWLYLKSRGLLDANNPIGELNWTFDNCPGQNKNRMVTRLFQYLVERGYFQKVNLIFLVKGHTKNLCDRAFNLLKIEYHNKNIYSTKELMKVLNTYNQVTAIKVDDSAFHDWDSIFEALYLRQKGFTEQPHIFSFSHDKPTSVSYSMYDGQPVTTKDLKKVVAPNHDETLQNATPAGLPASGMRDIKRMEL
jgi:hypothetical protein